MYKQSSSLLWIFFLFISILMNAETFAQEKDSRKIANKALRKANKAFKKEKWNDAVTQVCIALKEDLNRKRKIKEAQEILSQAYVSFISYNEGTIERLKKESSTYLGIETITQKSQIVRLYDQLIARNQEVAEVPNLSSLGIDKSAMKDYSNLISEAQAEYDETVATYVAEEYELGTQELAKNTKTNARYAYFHFQNVIRFNRNYKDVVQQSISAKDLATYRVVILSFKNLTGNSSNSSLNGLIVSELRKTIGKSKNKNAQFIRLVSGSGSQISVNAGQSVERLAAIAQANNADLIIYGDFSKITTNLSEINSREKEASREIVVEKKTVTDSNGEKQEVVKKRTITAKLNEKDQSKTVTLSGNLFVFNATTNTYLRKSSVDGLEYQSISWTEFVGGDREALTKSQKKRISRERPKFGSNALFSQEAAKSLGRKAADIFTRSINQLFN